jgi:hypothetical protein
MNRYQKSVLLKFASVIVITIIAVVAMVQFKTWVSRTEAMRAMENLSRIVIKYRKDNGSIPPQSYVDGIKDSLEGNARLGDLIYRARWIDFDSPPDEILAYNEKRGNLLLFGDDFIVLRLDGRVEWMNKKKFEAMLAQQQTPLEIQMMHK